MFEPRLDMLDQLPDRPLPEDLTDAEYRAAEYLSPAERNSLAWTHAIAAQQPALTAAMSRTPGARHTAVGFFDPYREEQTDGTFPGFGVIVYTDEAYARPDGRLEPIMADGVPFTVLPRAGVFQEHITITVKMKQSGRLACWATSRQGKVQGWLTARHCAAALGKVVDTAPDCVDAALVSTGTTGKGSVRKAFSALAAGLGVDMLLGSKQRTATVLDVSTDFGMLRSGKFPLRFSTDYAGVPGDSGSLLAEQKSTDPLGIYLGSFTPASNPNGPAAGIGLSVYQLEHMMDLEVYL